MLNARRIHGRPRGRKMALPVTAGKKQPPEILGAVDEHP
jgi:hypothetical protein